MRKLTHPEIVERQLGSKKQPKVPCSVILNNIRSLYNVGSIFRTCDGAGLEKLWICGITGHPPSNQISKTALGAENEVLWEHSKDIVAVIRDLKAKGYQIVLVEQMAESVPYTDFAPKFPVCIILGNEIGGVSDEIVSLCDAALEIEMAGLKNSLNVSVAFGVIAYYIRQCFLSKGGGS